MKLMVFLALTLIAISACHSNKEALNESAAKSLKELAEKRFGERYLIRENETGRYSIVSRKKKQFAQMGFDISFFIFDSELSSIIFEDELISGHLEWIGPTSIKAINRDRAERETYTYNAKTKDKEIK